MAETPKTLLDGFGEASEQVVALRAENERLRAVADAAHEVWWDDAMPSRWFEDNLFHVKKEHSDALKRALKAVGYTMRLKIIASPAPSSGPDHE